jgi:hypothetical protein
VFVAIAGERLDGHDFVADAFERGAIAAVVHRAGMRGTTIDVADTGRALLDLARDERRRSADVRRGRRHGFERQDVGQGPGGRGPVGAIPDAREPRVVQQRGRAAR